MNNQVRRANLTRKHSQSVRISLLAVILPAQPQLSVTLPCQKYWNFSYRPCQSAKKCNILSIIISYYIILHYITLHCTLHSHNKAQAAVGTKQRLINQTFIQLIFLPDLVLPPWHYHDIWDEQWIIDTDILNLPCWAWLRFMMSPDRTEDKKYVRFVIWQLNWNKAEPRTLLKFLFYWVS